MRTLIERLIAAHRVLNREIRSELRRRMPDALRLGRLRQERRAIKDRLSWLFPDPADMRLATREAIARARPA